MSADVTETSSGSHMVASSRAKSALDSAEHTIRVSRTDSTNTQLWAIVSSLRAGVGRV